jgi:hypothetical protein
MEQKMDPKVVELSPIECADELEDVIGHELTEEFTVDDDFDDSMDGDHASALASCGWGTDEDYGGYDD